MFTTRKVLSDTGCLSGDTARAATLSCHESSSKPHWVSPQNDEKITCLPCHAGHEFLQNFSVFVLTSILFHYCGALGKPSLSHDPRQEVRHQFAAHEQNSAASPEFLPADSHCSLYRGSILSTWAWCEEGGTVSLTLLASLCLFISMFLGKVTKLWRILNNCFHLKWYQWVERFYKWFWKQELFLVLTFFCNKFKFDLTLVLKWADLGKVSHSSDHRVSQWGYMRVIGSD